MASARLSRAERETQMLEIATEVFCERGYAGASMNEIAGRCGITKPMLYLYFDSKQRLYLACVNFVGDDLIAAIEGSVTEASSPVEQVLATAAGLFGFAEQRDRAWWGVIYAETMPADAEVASATLGYRDRIFGILYRAMAAALADPVDAELATHALIGAGESLLRWWVDQPDCTAAELTERLTRLVLPLLTSLGLATPEPSRSS
jgi:AcrR family transcriptional regulator